MFWKSFLGKGSLQMISLLLLFDKNFAKACCYMLLFSYHVF